MKDLEPLEIGQFGLTSIFHVLLYSHAVEFFFTITPINYMKDVTIRLTVPSFINLNLKT